MQQRQPYQIQYTNIHDVIECGEDLKCLILDDEGYYLSSPYTVYLFEVYHGEQFSISYSHQSKLWVLESQTETITLSLKQSFVNDSCLTKVARIWQDHLKTVGENSVIEIIGKLRLQCVYVKQDNQIYVDQLVFNKGREFSVQEFLDITKELMLKTQRHELNVEKVESRQELQNYFSRLYNSKRQSKQQPLCYKYRIIVRDSSDNQNTLYFQDIHNQIFEMVVDNIRNLPEKLEKPFLRENMDELSQYIKNLPYYQRRGANLDRYLNFLQATLVNDCYKLQDMKHNQLLDLLIETVKDEFLNLPKASDNKEEETKTSGASSQIQRPIDKPKQILVFVPMTLPGSGKSFIKEAFERFNNGNKTEVITFASDEILGYMTEQALSQNPNQTRQEALKSQLTQQKSKAFHYTLEAKIQEAIKSTAERVILFVKKNHPPNGLPKTLNLCQQLIPQAKIYCVVPDSYREFLQYPFSIQYIQYCLSFAARRQGHATVFGEESKKMSIVVKFMKFYRNVKFEKYFPEKRIIRFPFTYESQKLNGQFYQQLREPLLAVLKLREQEIGDSFQMQELYEIVLDQQVQKLPIMEDRVKSLQQQIN